MENKFIDPEDEHKSSLLCYINPKSKKSKKESKKPSEKKLSEKEILDLSKDEQVVLLKKLNAEDIPRYEKDRVALILKLQ